MKWIILILLFSCGQKNPPAKDLGDSDGDHILNYEEAGDELKKYTASVKPFNEMKGTLSFKTNMKIISLDFSNGSDLYKESFSLLTKRKDLLKKDEHFSEWSKLLPINPDTTLSLPENSYEVTMRFPESKDTPDYLSLKNEKLGDFLPVMKFYLSGKELEEILSGKTFLTMKRKEADVSWSQEANIRQRTYRVFWNDGKTTHVYYVSRELSLVHFLTLMKVSHPRLIQDENRLSWQDDTKDWWVRDLGEDDKIVVKASEKDIVLARENNYSKSLLQAKRENGHSITFAEIEKSPEARLILKLRGTKLTQSFHEWIHRYKRAAGSMEGQMDCSEWNRDIVSGPEIKLMSEEILKTIVVQSETKAFLPQELMSNAVEAHDDEGAYLEIALDSPDHHFKIAIPDRPRTTFTKTGVYQWECDAIPRKTGGIETNNEGHFNLKVEAYVEKIQE